MSLYDDKMTELADAVRAKSGATGKLTVEQMTEAVNSITSGGGGGEGGIDTSDANATADMILQGATAYARGEKLTGTMPLAPSGAEVNGNEVTIQKGYRAQAETVTVGNAVPGGEYTPTANSTTFKKDSFLESDLTIKGDQNLAPDNIKEGVSIFGVEGAFAGSGGGGGSMEFYKCASTNVTANTWSGYKAVLSNGVYTFEESVTDGLTFGGGYTPAPGFIYDSGATVMLSNLWSGLPQPADYDIFASFATPAAEKGGLFTLEHPSVDYGVKKNGILGAEFNDGIVSIPWNMSEDFTFSVRYKPLSGGENYYEGPLVRVGQDGGSTLYSIWVNMEWDMCMMHIEYGSGGTERFDVDTNHHIYTLVKSGDELKLYVDTELRTTDNHTCNVQDTSNIYVGGMGSYPARGHYSNLRIYSRALTAEEIAAIVQQSANN